MVRKEDKYVLVGFQQQKALSDSFRWRETVLAMVLLVSIEMFKNEVFPLVVLLFLSLY